MPPRKDPNLHPVRKTTPRNASAIAKVKLLTASEKRKRKTTSSIQLSSGSSTASVVPPVKKTKSEQTDVKAHQSRFRERIRFFFDLVETGNDYAVHGAADAPLAELFSDFTVFVQELRDYLHDFPDYNLLDPVRFSMRQERQFRELLELLESFVEDSNVLDLMRDWDMFKTGLVSIPEMVRSSFDDTDDSASESDLLSVDEETPLESQVNNDFLPDNFDLLGKGNALNTGTKSFLEYFTAIIKPSAPFSGEVTSTSTTLMEIWELFSPIHEAPNVSIREKRTAFLACLSGNAERCVNGFRLVDSIKGYRDMVSTLFETYGNREAEIVTIQRELTTLVPKAMTYEGIRDYVLTIYNSTVKLQVYGIEESETLLRIWPTIYATIPRTYWISFRNWCCLFDRGARMSATFFQKDPVKFFKELKTFFLDAVRSSQENLEVEAFPATAKPILQHEAVKKNEPSSSGTLNQGNNPAGCFICGCPDHRMWSCPVPLQDRIEKVRARGGCLNCLSPQHLVHQCRSVYRCPTCLVNDPLQDKAMHNSRICPYGQPSKSNRRSQGPAKVAAGPSDARKAQNSPPLRPLSGSQPGPSGAQGGKSS